jgi:hypothetical protein
MLADPVFYCLGFSSRMLDVPKQERTLRTKFQLGAFIPIRRPFKTVCRLGGMVFITQVCHDISVALDHQAWWLICQNSQKNESCRLTMQ